MSESTPIPQYLFTGVWSQTNRILLLKFKHLEAVITKYDYLSENRFSIIISLYTHEGRWWLCQWAQTSCGFHPDSCVPGYAWKAH